MRRLATILAALLAAAAPAAAATWIAPEAGAVLGAIEVVQVRAQATDMPTLVTDPTVGRKGEGVQMQERDCKAGVCVWEGLLDTRPLAAGTHTLGLTGVADPPEALQVTVDNARTVDRVHLWKDPYNPWPQEVVAGTPQRRLLWLANLGSTEQAVTVEADVDPDWQGLRWVEVRSNAQHAPQATWTLPPGGTLQLMLAGTAAEDSGVIDVRARTDGASAALRQAYGSPAVDSPGLGPMTLALGLVAIAALRMPRR